MFDKVLVPVNGSPLAECVIPHAAAFAKVFNSHITLVHVLEQPTGSLALPKADPLDWYLKKSEAMLYLDTVKARFEAVGIASETILLQGRASEQIIEMANNNKFDLLILSGSGDAENNRMSLSSTALKILQDVRTSILLVRSNQPITTEITDLSYQSLLVPLDGSQRAGAVLTLATALTQAHHAELMLVHIVSKPEMPRHMPPSQEDIELANRFIERNQEEGSKYLEQMQMRLPANTQTQLLVSDNVAATLQTISEEQNTDLLVLSAHGYSGEARWNYGSVANRFITNGTTSLLIVQDLPQKSLTDTGQMRAVRQSVR